MLINSKGKYAYDDATVLGFTLSALVWGAIGLVIGLSMSLQYILPQLNLGSVFQFGRLRPMHTNILAYGLGIGMEQAVFFFMVTRLTKRQLFFPKMARAQLYLFNFIMILATVTLAMGLTQTNEYAEFEWPIDILVVIMWVMFTINILLTIIMRAEKYMYVSLWFIIATLITVAVLYIVNNLAIPTGLFKSYHLFAGANSANVQWWFGHNAVGFLFTTPILAALYYFLPKALGVPIYSHRLSIIAFWGIIFMYLWTGAHHLVYTPLPVWIQTLGIAMSMLLIIPSWGSVVNIFMTLLGQWSRVSSHYLTKFFLLGITFYGLQTIQGPTQALRSLSQLIHYTDYVVGHVHMGTMGWVTMILSASAYYFVPKMYGLPHVFSIKLANIHFWLVLVGQLIFTVSLWVSGFIQGFMWKAMNPDGTLTYLFGDSLVATYPYHVVSTIGGVIYIVGILVFVFNIIMTIAEGMSLKKSTAGAK